MVSKILAGFCLILPSLISITAILAWIYTKYVSIPDILPILAGIRPVIIAIIIACCFVSFGKKGYLQIVRSQESQRAIASQ